MDEYHYLTSLSVQIFKQLEL